LKHPEKGCSIAVTVKAHKKTYNNLKSMIKLQKRIKTKSFKYVMIFIALIISINLNIVKTEAYTSPDTQYSLYEYKSVRIIIQNFFISNFSMSMPGNGSYRIKGVFVLYDNIEHESINKIKYKIDYISWSDNSCKCYNNNADGAICIIKLPRKLK